MEHFMVNRLDEVVVRKYDNINAVSLGIIFTPLDAINDSFLAPPEKHASKITVAFAVGNLDNLAYTSPCFETAIWRIEPRFFPISLTWKPAGTLISCAKIREGAKKHSVRIFFMVLNRLLKDRRKNKKDLHFRTGHFFLWSRRDSNPKPSHP